MFASLKNPDVLLSSTLCRVALCLVALCSVASCLDAADHVNWEEAPIAYSATSPQRNAIARLQMQLDAETIQLSHSHQYGYLPAILEKLKIPASSQVLVFSKTSLQKDKIAPDRPRAIYFNDDTFVGYVREGLLEIASADADLGMAFYTLASDRVDHPKFERQANRCLSCHGGARTKGLPGLLVRSVYPDLEGEPVISAGSFLTTHRSPLAQRWGGWYVTGRHGGQQHMGNYRLTQAKKPKSFDNAAGMNRDTLEASIDSQAYLTPHSDVVALMVLEHQVEAYNLLTHANFVTQHANWQCDQAIADGKDRKVAEQEAEARILKAVRPLAHYLLFVDESKLSEPVTGSSAFQQDFESMPPAQKARRSRQLSLRTRLMATPVSHLIYSRVFAEQPPRLQKALASELWIATDEENPSGVPTTGLSPEERQAVRRLLEEAPPPWFE